MRRDLAQKAKSRGGTLVTRAYKCLQLIQSGLLEKKIIYLLEQGHEESVGNDDVYCLRSQVRGG